MKTGGIFTIGEFLHSFLFLYCKISFIIPHPYTIIMKYSHKKEGLLLFYDITPPTYNPDLTLQPTFTGSKQGL